MDLPWHGHGVVMPHAQNSSELPYSEEQLLSDSEHGLPT